MLGTMWSRTLLILCAVVALALAGPPLASARGGDALRAGGHCGRGATAQLRLSAHDGAIRVEFEARGRRGGERWRVVLGHKRRGRGGVVLAPERPVRWRGRAGTRSGSPSFRVRRSVPDFSGADQVTVRASG